MKDFLTKRFGPDEGGATAIEYAMIAGGIAIAIIAGVNALGVNVNAMFGTVEAGFD